MLFLQENDLNEIETRIDNSPILADRHKSDLLVLISIFKNSNHKKVKRIVRKGGAFSKINYRNFTGDHISTDHTSNVKVNMPGDSMDHYHVFGLDKTDHTFNTRTGTKIREKELDNATIYEVNRKTYFLINEKPEVLKRFTLANNFIVRLDNQHNLIPDKVIATHDGINLLFRNLNLILSLKENTIYKVLRF